MCDLDIAEMSFGTEKDYEFLEKIGLAPENPGGFVNGKWKATGPVISTFNPADNQVCLDCCLRITFMY